MELKVLEIIAKYKLINYGGCIIVGLSGGADSVVLLHVLNTLKDKMKFTLRAVHVNHMIRGEESIRDQNFSVELCKKMGIEIDVIQKDCPAFAKSHKLSLEESARTLRYEAFRSILEKMPNSKIAVAHNMNDNTETMLMRLLRGTSAYGLRGMDICHENIIRPLLFCAREEIETYAEKNNLSFITDSSNSDLNYTRNKIRGELIPHIKEEYNPNIISTLNRLSVGLKNDADYFASIVEQAYSNYVESGPGWVIISKEAFLSEHEAVTSRLIRLCVRKLNGTDKDFDNVHMNLAVNLLNLKSGTRLSMPSGLGAANTFGDIALYNPLRPIEEIPLAHGQIINIDADTYLSVSSEEIREEIKGTKSLTASCTGVFICDKITDKPILRGRKNGDIIKLENGKTIKFKDFLIQREIPVFLRDRLYVVADGNRILMVLSDLNYIAPANVIISENRCLYIQLWRRNNG